MPARAKRRGRQLALLGALLLSGCGWGAAGPYSGQVVDSNGQGLPGAVIASDQAATLSDGTGHFTLATAMGTVTVRKMRYHSRQVNPAQESTVILQSASRSLRVAWDQRWHPPAMGGLMQFLQTQGFAIRSIESGDLPGDMDLYVLPTPAWFTPEAYQRYLQVAGAGGKIVLLGEWGGYDGVDMSACNALGAKAGIRFATAMVRTYAMGLPQEWLTVRSFRSGALAQGMEQGVRLFTAGALDLEPQAYPLIQTASEGVRIQGWSVGSQTLCAAGPLGRGMILALSDTSLWTDETGSDGVPHWKTLDNARFAVNLFNW